MGMKACAYWLTGSVGLLSDAIESLVNLVGGMMALAMLTIAVRPADDDHPFGHSKAEYFSSGVEGTLILIAAISIAVTAIQRLIAPKPLEQLGIGLAVSVGASLVNLAVALLLLKAAKKNRSITLEANAQHLLTDVWTSVGVVVGVGMVAITGWNRFDALAALAVAANIVWTGSGIIRRSIEGLMDKALPVEQQELARDVLERLCTDGVRYEEMRTRQSGGKRFVSVRVLVPGTWTVHRGHELLDQLEEEIVRVLPDTSVATHMEPLDHPAVAEKTVQA